jgi:uncharacterized protein YcgI (DUF1989 family)
MAIALALTDTQLAVITRLRASTGAADLDELAAAAIEHDRQTPPDPRWRQPRPRGPGAGGDATAATGGADANDGPPTTNAAAPDTDHRATRLQLTLPAASGGALALEPRDLLTIEQLADGQGVDLRAFGANGVSFSAAQTRWMHGINPTRGTSLWRSQPPAPLLTIVRDTAPGHDLCFPPCSGVEYQRYTGIDGHVGCMELHAAALAAAGGDPWPGDDVLNLWLPSAVRPDGQLVSWPAACRTGDAVSLRADDAALVTLTTCPDDLYGTSQYEPKPVRVTVERPGTTRVPRVFGWPSKPPSATLAHHRPTVSLSAGELEHVDHWARRGWLGDDRPSVMRALILRLYESLNWHAGS